MNDKQIEDLKFAAATNLGVNSYYYNEFLRMIEDGERDEDVLRGYIWGCIEEQ